ncbi:PolC-type DNA polymerase III [Pseudomonas sp. M30-35]|uniref:3'-5' exonuclease n=1 Tax=Pseudomonas sp. M30-35 TaxID=1981174 RepID=UPI000B3C75C8|nr:3'-5' exonuclease [Pseudomonas sp. M30-35]ARU86932.1 DNA polymerase III subunit epsilon [Pseudomonas sp. M30-35]
MNALTWLTSRTAQLSSAQQQRLEQLPVAASLDTTALNQQRMVVVDLETSGLDVKRDELLSIGAVVIENGAIDLAQQFECTLLRENHKVSASVLIHGLAPSAIAAGTEPADALLDFMEFLGSSPLLAFHARFDQRMLSRALKQSLGYRLQHSFFDVADLAPLLCPDASLERAGLDDWIRHFGLQVQQRHNASADALVTAELGLIMLSKARQQQLDSLLALQQRLNQWSRRPRKHSF